MQLRILLLPPTTGRLRVLLIGPPNRSLYAQSHLPQQPTHRTVTQLYPQSPGDQLPHHTRRPQRKRKLQLQRILPHHRVINPLQPLRLQLRWPPPSLARLQLPPSPAPVQRQPAKHRAQVHSHGRRHFCRLRPRCQARNPSPSQFRQRPMIQFPSVCVHGPLLYHPLRSMATTIGTLICHGKTAVQRGCRIHPHTEDLAWVLQGRKREEDGESGKKPLRHHPGGERLGGHPAGIPPHGRKRLGLLCAKAHEVH